MSDDLMNQVRAKNGAHSSSNHGQKGTKKRSAMVVCAAAVIVAAIVITGGIVYSLQSAQAREKRAQMEQTVEVDAFYPGTVVQGVELGGMTMTQAKTALQAVEPKVRGNYDVKVKHAGKSWEIGTDDLSFDYNTDTVLKEAYAYARTGKLKDRYELVQKLKETPKTYSISASMKTDSLRDKLAGIVKKIERDPKDASVKSFNAATGTFTFEQGENGISVDSQELTDQVQNILKNQKTGEVEVPTKETSYQVGIGDLQNKMERLGTYSTTSTNTKSGNHNMATALSAVNGTTVPAGGMFSYLKTVGNPNRASGYLEAGAILNGKLIQSYGGGICQTSTTIYGAALRSNMKIVERYSHSIRSSYCPIGQDAAVSYGSLDFKFKNTSKYPIYIAAGMKGKVLTVTFYGVKSTEYDEISVASQLTQTIPEINTPKYTVDASMKTGTMKLDAKARQGYKAVAQRIFYKNGKVVKTENLGNSYYRPAPAFYSIGPNTDVKTAKLVGGSSSGKPVNGSPASGKPESSTPVSDNSASVAPAPNKPSSSTPASSGKAPAESTHDQDDPLTNEAESDIVIPE